MIAVLVVSLIMLSTQLYILEAGRSVTGAQTLRAIDFVLAVKLGSKHIVTGSLAEISVGEAYTILNDELEQWIALIRGMYEFGRPMLNFTLENNSSYTNGTCLSWNNEGVGASSSSANFSLYLLDNEVYVELSYAANVSTSITLNGTYRTVEGDTKQVNVTCKVLNEGEPALAKNTSILFQNSSSWLPAETQDNYLLTDYGNGTYLVSFEASIPQANISVSAQAFDLREIYVQANSTCVDST